MGNAGKWDGLGGEVGGNNEGEHVSRWHLLQKPDTMRSPPEEHSAKTTGGETPLVAPEWGVFTLHSTGSICSMIWNKWCNKA